MTYRCPLTIGAMLVATASVSAQDARRSLDLTVNHTGISIGDSREVNGLRINARDTRLKRVDGINLTFWKPAKSSHGTVRGIALGAPFTGGTRITGLAAGAGIEAEESLRGISVALIGSGAGKDVRGIHLAGIGLGAGGDVRGIAVGGVGIGAGGSIRGLMVGGIGAGAGGDASGIVIGGIGAAAGGSLSGIAIGGIGVGAGGTLRGLAIGGIGVGAPTVQGIAIGGVGVGGHDLHGAFLAPITIKVDSDGVVRGMAISAFNDARTGTQRGLMIGMLNIATHLHGVQVGLLNIARGNPSGRRVLPIINWNFGK